MTTPDVSRLSYAELLELSRELEKQIEGKRAEELKVLADGFARKVEAGGFSVAEAIQALQPYAGTRQGASKGAGGKSAPVLYRDPANPANVWSGRGRAARWLADYEEQGRSRNEFKV